MAGLTRPGSLSKDPNPHHVRHDSQLAVVGVAVAVCAGVGCGHRLVAFKASMEHCDAGGDSVDGEWGSATCWELGLLGCQ